MGKALFFFYPKKSRMELGIRQELRSRSSRLSLFSSFFSLTLFSRFSSLFLSVSRSQLQIHKMPYHKKKQSSSSSKRLELELPASFQSIADFPSSAPLPNGLKLFCQFSDGFYCRTVGCASFGLGRFFPFVRFQILLSSSNRKKSQNLPFLPLIQSHLPLLRFPFLRFLHLLPLHHHLLPLRLHLAAVIVGRIMCTLKIVCFLSLLFFFLLPLVFESVSSLFACSLTVSQSKE